MLSLSVPSAMGASHDAGAVFALHCSGSSGRQWRALQAVSGGTPFHAPDLVGSGARAAWRGDRPFDLAEEAKELHEMLRVLKGPVHLVGHSYGGALALHLALGEPSRVASLTLYEPSCFHLLRDGDAASQQAHREIAGVAAACITGLMSGDYAAAAERFVRYWSGPDAWSSLRPDARQTMTAALPTFVLHFRALLAEPTRVDDLSRLRCPTLILSGDRSPAPARRVAALLGTSIPRAERRVLSGYDHMAPLSRAGEVADHIVAFQRAVTTPVHLA